MKRAVISNASATKSSRKVKEDPKSLRNRTEIANEEYKALVKHHSKSLMDLSALSEIRGKSGSSVGF